MAVVSTSPDGWVAVAGVDFGFEGAASVRLLVRSEVPSGIKVFMDSIEGIPAAVLETNSWSHAREGRNVFIV